MKDLQIILRTNINPAKVDISQLEASLEYVIESIYGGVCRSVEFREVEEYPHDSRPSYACTCRTCGLKFASTLKTADWCGCTKELPHDHSRPSYTCRCFKCGQTFASMYQTADNCGCS